MSQDTFASYGDDADNPTCRAFTVAPSDSAEHAILPRALMIGGGDLVLRAVDSPADVTVGAGQIVPIRAQYVRATGTTATNILALHDRAHHRSSGLGTAGVHDPHRIGRRRLAGEGTDRAGAIPHR